MQSSDKTAVQAAPPARRRIHILDMLRGAAIAYMLFYHTFYDLAEIWHLDWAKRIFDSQRPALLPFGILFVFLGGVTIRFARNPAMHGARLLIVAGIFSLVTSIIFPGYGIYFGILHMFSVSMLVYTVVGKWLDNLPWWLPAGIFLLLYILTNGVPSGYFGINGLFTVDVPDILTYRNMLYPFGFITDTYSSADYYPLLPWLFMFLCGTCAGRLLERKLPEWVYKNPCPPLCFLGRHSLTIYILHQPIIYAILFLILG